jgi:hypothetical protein
MAKYSATGPFANNALPGMSATFLNNIETFLGYGADSNITADGSGNATVASITFSHGSIARIAFGFNAVTTTGTTITHNLGAVPDCVLIQCAGGNTSVAVATGGTLTTASMVATSATNVNCWWLVIKS